MPKQILFIQGAGEGAHAADAKLVESLQQALGPDYEIHFPVMPNEADPAMGIGKRPLKRSSTTRPPSWLPIPWAPLCF